MASATAGLTEAALYDALVNYLVSMARLRGDPAPGSPVKRRTRAR